MSPGFTFVFLLLAFIVFVLAIWPGTVATRRPINLVALGLALWVFIFVYAAGQALR